jgi:hypothetical protein
MNKPETDSTQDDVRTGGGMTVEITCFTKADGPLTKRISLSATGAIVSDGSACLMVRGTAERVQVENIDALAALIGALGSNQAITLGALRDDLPAKVEVTTAAKLNGNTRKDLIARTGTHLVYQGRAFMLLDFDSKGMPDQVADRLKKLGGFWNALTSVLPPLRSVANVLRSSTSAGLFRSDTGDELPGSDGVHVYVPALDGSDIERFLRTLHDRCWLAGLGWMMVSASGALLERSIVDRMVAGPERLVFEGQPVLVSPLAQDQERRRPRARAGDELDTAAACPPLSIAETSRLEELIAREEQRLAPAAAKARVAFIERQAKKLVAAGMSELAAKQTVLRQCEGVLRPDVVLLFDNDELAGMTVADVLADPGKFEGETLADPVEGVDYGRCCAKIMRRADGTPWINSFAHGRAVYALKYDAAAVRKTMEAAAKDTVVATFLALALDADLDAVEIDQLRQLAAELSGRGVRTIAAALKVAQQKRDAQLGKERRQRKLAQRRDQRPRLLRPFNDAEYAPVMSAIESVVVASTDTMPPARDIDGALTRARKVPILDLHAFTSAGANAEPAASPANLPPPEKWVLLTMGDVQVTEMIEAHIEFIDVVDEDYRSVHLPAHFVRHFMRREDSLPIVVAIAQLPIVLADGNLLTGNGLDRERGIFFTIPKELTAIVPVSKERAQEGVEDAMKFLCDDWLCDVATDYTGKCVIISAALTVIERSLLPDRPAYSITAGRRGNGKTTTIKMLLTPLTGSPPAAASWSTDEEERRKALLSYFMRGESYILWDNIPRGSQITCPHIERSCTSAYYADRRLGVSEMVTTAASSVHFFTGNNISVSGDLVSRTLHTRLDADRPDPENREFRHPDPIAWTEQNRGKILGALYTILLGNPQLSAPANTENKTRFKLWWRLVGSAVENAAGLAGKDLDFRDLFLSQEGDDEDAASLADVLETLLKRWPEKQISKEPTLFTANKVAEFVNNIYDPSPDKTLLRDWLKPEAPANWQISVHTITRRLSGHLDEPVMSGKRVLKLRSCRDEHTKVLEYYVVIKECS